MASEHIDRHPKSPGNLFGLGRNPNRPGEPLVVTKDTTVWEIYNHKASEIDREMIKDWNDSLSTLLIFVSQAQLEGSESSRLTCVQAALYSAILTAFIIESMKLLQEDLTETTRDILYFISQQLANTSFPPFPRVEYETPQYAVIVNGLFFTSLSCSLIAALLAVLALQWVANYDMGLNTSSTRKRALQRHTRWMGIEQWKLGEVIASLPLLIFVSLFLSFIGIADWLWHVNRAISSIVIGGIGIGCLVYSITNIISIIKLDAPFRTPVSKGLAPLIRRAAVWMRLLVQEFPSELLNEYYMWSDIRWGRSREIWNGIYSRATVPLQNFAKCEELVIEGKDETALESLVWLANSIEITPASRPLFLTLTKEITQLPGELLLTNKKIDQAPWESIFTELCSPYFSRKSIDECPEEDAKVIRHICTAFSMISSGVTTPAFSTFFGAIESDDPQTTVAIHLLKYRQLGWSPLWQLVWSELCHSISSIDGNTLHFTLLLIEHEWPSMGIYIPNILSDLVTACTNPFDNAAGTYPIPVESLRVILQIIAHQDDHKLEANNQREQRAIIDRYISVVRRMKEGTNKDLGDRLHRAIQKQLLVHISLIDFSLPSCINELVASLELLLHLISCRPLALMDKERDEFIHILTKIRAENLYQLIHSNIHLEESLLNCLHYSYGTDDQPFDRWTSLVLAINEYFESGSMQSQEDRRNILSMMLTNSPYRSDYNPETSLQDTLIRIKDPSLALWLIEYCPNDWRFEALVNPNFNAWTSSVENTVSMVLNSRVNPNHSKRYISFLRTMIIDGTPACQRIAIALLGLYYQECRVNSKQVFKVIFIMSQYFINLLTRILLEVYQHQFSIGSSNTTRKVTIFQ
jgi:hypothetical protein